LFYRAFSISFFTFTISLILCLSLISVALINLLYYLFLLSLLIFKFSCFLKDSDTIGKLFIRHLFQPYFLPYGYSNLRNLLFCGDWIVEFNLFYELCIRPKSWPEFLGLVCIIVEAVWLNLRQVVLLTN
jgi:hypothetical protein